MEFLRRTQTDPAQASGRSSADAAEPRRLGQYRVLRRIGEGGMGVVYLAYDEGNDRQVALKVLNEQLASSQGYIDRFYREAKSVALLNHPSIVRGFGAGQDPATSKYFLVLEFVDGISAQALLEQLGRLSVGDAVHIALDVARALEHAHSRNVIHRDIKPDNILLTRTGVSKLADLGLARRTDETSHLTGARQGFGTPYYMPYEQALNARHADGRSDIYALGATLYHLLTGAVPFTGESPLEIVEAKDRGEFVPAGQINQAVPGILDQIIGRMLARQPRERYQTASELIVDLERSRLAAAVPSYADPEQALKDPWVRACLASSGQPTQPDLSVVETPPPGSEDVQEPNGPATWIARYLGRDGRWKRARLSTEQVTERLRDGGLPPETEVCGNPREGFRPVSGFPDFHGAIRSKPTAHKKSPPRAPGLCGGTWSLVFVAGVTSLLAGALALIYLLFVRGN